MSSEQQAPSAPSQPPRARRGAARPDPASLLQGLERLREVVHQRLDRIESMAKDGATALPADPSDRERELRRKIVELEERQARIVAEAKRKEQEWLSGLEQLENERRLITEAWERLERERIDGAGSGPGHPAQRNTNAHGNANTNANGNGNHHAASPEPVFRPAVAPESNDVITHAILRQFQALRSDVRRNAGGRRPQR